MQRTRRCWRRGRPGFRRLCCPWTRLCPRACAWRACPRLPPASMQAASCCRTDAAVLTATPPSQTALLVSQVPPCASEHRAGGNGCSRGAGALSCAAGPACPPAPLLPGVRPAPCGCQSRKRRGMAGTGGIEALLYPLAGSCRPAVLPGRSDSSSRFHGG